MSEPLDRPQGLDEAFARVLTALGDLAALIDAARRVASSPPAPAAPTSSRPPPGEPAGAPASPPQAQPVLTPIQRAALAAVRTAQRPIKGVVVAARCVPPRPYNTHMREALSELCDLGLVRKDPDGGYVAVGGRGDAEGEQQIR